VYADTYNIRSFLLEHNAYNWFIIPCLSNKLLYFV